jgi:hypothetical protein
MADLSLAQRLALCKFLTDALKALRLSELLPQAAGEMPSGARLPVMFGGQLAGWASMPQPSKKSAYVDDDKALLAWAEKHHAAKVLTTETAEVTDDVLAVLEEHLPSAIVKTRQVDPQWVSDLTDALRDKGFYVTSDGEKLTEVPGITVPESDPPAPRVDLKPEAGAIIGAAWQAGDIPVGDLIALPAASGAAA